MSGSLSLSLPPPPHLQGHGRSRALPQLGAHVLQVRPRGQSAWGAARVCSLRAACLLGGHVRTSSTKLAVFVACPFLLPRGAAAAIIVYDITNPDSFNRAKSWVRELQRQGNPNMIMALAGADCKLHGACTHACSCGFAASSCANATGRARRAGRDSRGPWPAPSRASCHENVL